MTQQKAPINNTPLSDKELKHFKTKLEDELEKARSKIDEFKENLEDLQNSTSQSAQTHHQGDLGTSESRRETLLSHIEKEKEKIDKIKVAMDRMADGNYGVCVVTGKPIQKERLEAIPYAIHSVEALQE